MNNQHIKVGMIILMQSNIEEGVSFYQKLGFKLKFHLKQKWAEFIVDNIKIGLCPTSTEPFDRHCGVVLEVDDLESFRNNIKQESIEFVQEPVVAVHGIMASIKDPSGNILDVYQPTPEKIQQMAKEIIDKEASFGNELTAKLKDLEKRLNEEFEFRQATHKSKNGIVDYSKSTRDDCRIGKRTS